MSFEPECSEFINTCNATEKQLNLFQIGTHKFTGWLHLIKLFVDVNHNEISPSFDALCDGIASVIEHLMLPEQYFPVERGKPVPRPKYNPPAQTLLVKLLFYRLIYYKGLFRAFTILFLFMKLLIFFNYYQ